MTEQKKLIWEEKYSVGVELIDNQHKMMFSTINELLDTINTMPTTEKLTSIIDQLVQYKKYHFATEEKFFKEFNYEKTAEHMGLHQEFNERLNKIKEENGDNIIALAFALVDFLEDWLINHLMTADQDYKECFKTHDLK